MLKRCAAIALATLAACGPARAEPCRAASPGHTVALVELYTSQGCSSCPPADRWLSRLPAGQQPASAIALALHIGYWDYLGWKDPFARVEFNRRQEELAALSGSRRIYTPEVFVGARELADWSNPEGFARAVAAINRKPARASIRLEANVEAGAADASAEKPPTVAVRARWSADAAARSPQLLLAITRSGFTTAVAAGENRGETLRDDHVVRAWSGPFRGAGEPLAAELPLPPGPGAATLVAIAQDDSSGEVLQAVELPLTGCGAAAGR
jgi:hypothetical protein